MFHFHQENFDFEESSFNLKPLANDLPTTHNSPGSFKSGSLKLQDSPFNCSFDQGNQASHANSIWDASIKYLTAALTQFVDASKGFNNSNLNRFMNENCQQKDLDQTIFQNSNLKIQQKHQFISDLHSQTELKGLMGQLLKLFNEQIFHELTYVVFKIWEKKNRTQKQQKNIFPSQEPLVPQFNCFWGYEEEEVQKETFSPFFQEKNMDQVIQKADRCTQQISNDLFFDRKIKLLNLRESHNINSQADVPSLFGQFFKQISRSVFLSVEGFYQNSNSNKICEQYETFDFDFEMNQVSALEQLQVQNKFVRSFSQDFEDDEQDFEFDSAPKKKRKLQ